MDTNEENKILNDNVNNTIEPLDNNQSAIINDGEKSNDFDAIKPEDIDNDLALINKKTKKHFIHKKKIKNTSFILWLKNFSLGSLIVSLVLIALFVILFYSAYPLTYSTKDTSYVLIAFSITCSVWFFIFYFTTFFLYQNRIKKSKMNFNNRDKTLTNFNVYLNYVLILVFITLEIQLILWCCSILNHNITNVLGYWNIVFGSVCLFYVLNVIIGLIIKATYDKKAIIHEPWLWVILLVLVCFYIISFITFGVEIIKSLDIIPGKALFITSAIISAFLVLPLAIHYKNYMHKLFPLYEMQNILSNSKEKEIKENDE